jgi:hypothetical protein
MPLSWRRWGKSTHYRSRLAFTESDNSYKQELRRNFSLIEVFGIAFSIMGLLPSIASTLAYSIPAGPVGLVWGWFLASLFIFIVGLAMADLVYSLSAYYEDMLMTTGVIDADFWRVGTLISPA